MDTQQDQTRASEQHKSNAFNSENADVTFATAFLQPPALQLFADPSHTINKAREPEEELAAATSEPIEAQKPTMEPFPVIQTQKEEPEGDEIKEPFSLELDFASGPNANPEEGNGGDTNPSGSEDETAGEDENIDIIQQMPFESNAGQNVGRNDNPSSEVFAPDVQNFNEDQAIPSNDIMSQMENSFGQSFADVQIHENSETAQSLGARAFAQGNDIHFAPGEYNPNTPEGRSLLGHELTHVVQQKQGRVQETNQMQGFSLNDDSSLEKEADEMGAKAARGEMLPFSTNTPSTNQAPIVSEPVQAKSTSNSSNNSPIQRYVDLQGNSPTSEQATTGTSHESTPENDTTGAGSGESATIELPLDSGTASTRGELRVALLRYRLRFLDLIARLESQEGSQFDLQSLREIEQRQLSTSERFNSGDSNASLQPMEVGIVRVHFPNETRHYQEGLNTIKQPIISALATIQNTSRPSAMTAEIAEARRVAFENNDSDELTLLNEITGNINTYTTRLNDVISFAAEHSNRVAGSRFVNQLYGVSSRIAGFAEKVGRVFTALGILNSQSDGGGTNGAQATIQQAQSSLAGMDMAMSFVSGVPLIGSLWSNYYQPAAAACLEGLQRIIQSRARDVITGIRSRYDWTSSTPPQFDGNDSRFINGGREQVFPFLWRIFFGNYHFLRSAEEYFIDHESQISAGLGAPMSITNRYNPLVDSHIENFETWATLNKRDLWIMLYGARMPFPGSTSVEGSMREYNREEF